MNPERKQTFIEVYSEALTQCYRKADQREMSYSIEDIPHKVLIKMKRIEAYPDSFDFTSEPMVLACEKLNISPTRANVLEWLDGKELVLPSSLASRIEQICNGEFDDPEHEIVRLAREYPDFKITKTEDGVNVEAA